MLQQRIRKLYRFESPSVNDWVIYFTAFIILQIPAIINFYYNDGVNNPYTFFAQSLLHGNLTLPPMNSYGDMIFYHGSYYLPYPPLPSLILAPFVVIFGVNQVNTVAIATIMACISLYLIYKILLRLQIIQEYFNWLVLAVIFGTGYWFALFTSHHVYAFAHITSFLFQLLIINEILGKRRWWLVGVYIGCSFLTRQFTIFYVVFALGYMLYLHQNQQERIKIKNILTLFISIGLFVAVYLAYNYIRFGSIFDTGYKHIIYIGVLKERVNEYGVFNIRYFLFNLYSFLIKGFNIEFQGKDYLAIKDMDLWGTSLLAASPFLIASLKAGWPKILKVSAWLTIILILTGQLFYHNNGFHQINTSRFSLDFLPLLILLTALGVNHLPKWLFKGLVIYAVLLNIISFLIHSIYQVR
jgi:4-amino-4-deoxy-L-arabinose transferase-like glycosyltransferase